MPHVPQTGPVNRPSWLARLRAALLAQPGADGAGTILLQLTLIILWHPVVLLLAWAATEHIMVPASKFWHELGLTSSYIRSVDAPELSLPSGAEQWRALLVGLALLAIVEACLVYLPIWVTTRPTQLSLPRFVRLWWRTWLWGTLLIPAGAVLISLLPEPANEAGPLGLPVYMLVLPFYFLAAPAWLAWREKPRRPRLARWRPVCPECGYSLRRAVADRCPECGQPFPTASRVYRRWAWQRLVWDRANRGSLLFAYIKTIFMIVFRPRRAARGLLLPDHYPRAIRWAATHLLLLALLGLALGSDLYFTKVITDPLTGAPDYHESGPAAGVVSVWAAQSAIAWLFVTGGMPLLGIALGVAIPGRHPAAKRGIAKWSLFASLIPLFVFLASYGISVTRDSWLIAGSGIPWWNALFWDRSAAQKVLVWMPPLYAVWWALGVSANPYLPRRSLGVFAVHAALYIGVWVVLTTVCFNAEGLGDLL